MKNDIVLRVTITAAVIAAVMVTLSAATQTAPQGDEPPPAFKAGDLLTPAVARGAHHQVGDAVRTDGYFHEFTMTSEFGAFDAIGRTMLAVRIQEVDALAALRDVSKTEVFLEAAGQSVVKVGQAAANVVTDPVSTAKGVGAGIKRFGVNLGRRTQRAIDSQQDSRTEGDESAKGDGAKGDSAAESAAKSVFGVTSATRRWAKKVGVDPYTTNTVLRQALEDIGKVDAAGSIATKVVVPIPAVVGMTSTVGDLVWGKDPEEVRKINEQRLKALTVPDAVAKQLFANPHLTLTYQTRLVAALTAVKASGCADYVQTAAEARDEREALFFVESVEMLQQWHARQPVVSVLTDSRALVARDRRGDAAVLLPLDWVRWTAATDETLSAIAARARRELNATHLRMVLTGGTSPRAARAIAAQGWTIVPPPGAGYASRNAFRYATLWGMFASGSALSSSTK
jgi:hypothetical protein